MKKNLLFLLVLLIFFGMSSVVFGKNTVPQPSVPPEPKLVQPQFVPNSDRPYPISWAHMKQSTNGYVEYFIEQLNGVLSMNTPFTQEYTLPVIMTKYVSGHDAADSATTVEQLQSDVLSRVSEHLFEASNGNITVNFVVLSPSNGNYYIASGSKSVYSTDDGSNGMRWGGAKLAREMVQQIDSEVDFSDFAINGSVPCVLIAHAGPGAEMGYGDHIWSHVTNISSANHWYPTQVGGGALTVDGVTVDRYTAVPVRNMSSTIAKIGVYSHELGHGILYLPDYYQTRGDRLGGIGTHCLMAHGSYGSQGNDANYPVHFNLAIKYMFGWLNDVQLVNSDGTYIISAPSSGYYSGVIIPDNRFGDNISGFALEYIIDSDLEYGEGFPGQNTGLVRVYHFNFDQAYLFGNNDSTNQGVSVVQADGLNEIELATSWLDQVADRGDFYPYNGNNSITALTNPNSAGKDGFVAVEITNITINAGTASFDVRTNYGGSTVRTNRIADGVYTYSSEHNIACGILIKSNQDDEVIGFETVFCNENPYIASNFFQTISGSVEIYGGSNGSVNVSGDSSSVLMSGTPVITSFPDQKIGARSVVLDNPVPLQAGASYLFVLRLQQSYFFTETADGFARFEYPNTSKNSFLNINELTTLYNTRTGVLGSDFGNIALGVHFKGESSDTPLPVELLSFTANAQNGRTTVKWSTASELDNAGFVLYAGEDSLNLHQVASYLSSDALKGMGTSGSGKSYAYSFTEHASFVKLTSIDYSGLVHNLGTIRVNEADKSVKVHEFDLYQNYPNPFNPVTTISFSMPNAGIAKLTVYDVLGRAVKNVSIDANAGMNTYSFNGSRLASGMYYYRIVHEQHHQIKKMMLVK